MYRSKDFILMDVINLKGRKVGFVKDILIDFHKGYVIGFCISPYKIFGKSLFVLMEDILSFNSNMVIKNTSSGVGFKISQIKGMDVIDNKGNILGMVEDIIFKDNEFSLSGIVVSRGFIRNLIYGKKIYLMQDLILGDKNIAYLGDEGKITFVTMAHEVLEVDKDE